MRTRCIRFKCDRCGFQRYYELDEDGDGSFKEPCYFTILSIEDNTHLCPECEYKRRKLMDEFMKGDKGND